jgi:hypothetical protein
MSTLAKALPSPVRFDVGKGQSLSFCRIGLNIWSEFCDYILDRRTKRVNDLTLNDEAKAGLYKTLVGNGLGMEDMLTEAATTDGMRWIICRCSISDATDDDLAALIPLGKVPVLFQKLADMEPALEEEEAQANPPTESRTGA